MFVRKAVLITPVSANAGDKLPITGQAPYRMQPRGEPQEGRISVSLVEDRLHKKDADSSFALNGRAPSQTIAVD